MGMAIASSRNARPTRRGRACYLCGNIPVGEVILRIIAERPVEINAIEQTQLRGQRRVDGVGRLKI